MSAPVDEEYRESMNTLANLIDRWFNYEPGKPKQHGFALLVFKFDDAKAGRMNWISNASREDMLSALAEMRAQLEGRAHEAPEAKQ